MNDELTKAAVEAGDALGMSVEVVRVGVYQVPRIEIWLPMDDESGGQPVEIADCDCHNDARFYLSGLECGARIMREQHARLRRAADDTYLWCCTYAQDFRLTDICQSLKAGLVETEALSELEG